MTPQIIIGIVLCLTGAIMHALAARNFHKASREWRRAKEMYDRATEQFRRAESYYSGIVRDRNRRNVGGAS